LAFLGQFEYTLDAKNRLTIPAKFRAALSDGVVLSKSLEACVQVWTPAGWERFSERAMGSRDLFDPAARLVERYFHSGSYDAQLDAAGRIMLPPALIEHANLRKELVVIGNGESIELWAPEGWRLYMGDVDIQDQAARLARGADASG
jgi:MraZ protein